MNRKLSDESFGDIRAEINFLLVDETEAIKSYDDILNHPDLTEGMKLELEEIRNEEIAHIVKLSNLLKRFATGEKSEETAKELGDTNYVYETDKPNIKWRIHQSKKGGFYFADPNGSIYEENGREVWFASKESAGQFFIKKLFNKSLWGNEIPRVVVDSKKPVIKALGKWEWDEVRGDWYDTKRHIYYNELLRNSGERLDGIKKIRDSKGFVIGNNSKTEFLRWSNDKYIVAKSPDAATLYPTIGSARVALQLANWDDKKYRLFELNNSYELMDSNVAKFKVGETVKVSQYGSSWKDKIRKVLTREEAEKQFKSIVSGTSNEIKHWYILESKDVPVAEFRISPIV